MSCSMAYIELTTMCPQQHPELSGDPLALSFFRLCVPEIFNEIKFFVSSFFYELEVVNYDVKWYN